MAFALASILRKTLMLTDSASTFDAPGAPSTDLIALAYQFIMLLILSVTTVCLWFWQLKRSLLWDALANVIRRDTARV